MTDEREPRYPPSGQLVGTLIRRVNNGGLLQQEEWEDFEDQLPGAVNAGEFVKALGVAANLVPQNKMPFILAREVLHTVTTHLLPKMISKDLGGAGWSLLVALIGGTVFAMARNAGVKESDGVSVGEEANRPRSLQQLLTLPELPFTSNYLYNERAVPSEYKTTRNFLKVSPFFSDEDEALVLQVYSMFQEIEAGKPRADRIDLEFDKPEQQRLACRTLLHILIERSRIHTVLPVGSRRPYFLLLPED